MFKEILADAWPIIEAASPIVATALGGPLGGTASIVFKLLGNAFNCPTHDIPTLVKNIIEDPEAHAKLLTVQSGIPDAYKQMLKDILRLPDEAEINIKMKWESQNKAEG